jgi:folate-binding protein YgfZ
MVAPFAALEMTGPDRVEFLQRLLTNSVDLEPGKGAHAYLLTVQGRPQLELWVYETGDRFWLVCHAADREHAFRDLDNYHFSEKLKLVDRTSEPCLVGFESSLGPLEVRVEGDVVRCSFGYYGEPAELVWGGRPAGPAYPPEELERLRIEAGSASPAECTEKTMFLEVAGPDAYSETKGCYPGQEVVARTLHRGHVNRALRRVQGMAPLTKGEKLLADEREAGWVAAAVDEQGLAFVRREFWEGAALRTQAGVGVSVLTGRE